MSSHIVFRVASPPQPPYQTRTSYDRSPRCIWNYPDTVNLVKCCSGSLSGSGNLSKSGNSSSVTGKFNDDRTDVECPDGYTAQETDACPARPTNDHVTPGVTATVVPSFVPPPCCSLSDAHLLNLTLWSQFGSGPFGHQSKVPQTRPHHCSD